MKWARALSPFPAKVPARAPNWAARACTAGLRKRAAEKSAGLAGAPCKGAIFNLWWSCPGRRSWQDSRLIVANTPARAIAPWRSQRIANRNSSTRRFNMRSRCMDTRILRSFARRSLLWSSRISGEQRFVLDFMPGHTRQCPAQAGPGREMARMWRRRLARLRLALKTAPADQTIVGIELHAPSLAIRREGKIPRKKPVPGHS